MSQPSCPSCFFFVPFVSAVSPLEFPHEGDQRVHAFLGERVVDRRAHAADRAVALEAVEPGCGRLLDELLLELLGGSLKVMFIRERSAFSAVPR